MRVERGSLMASIGVELKKISKKRKVCLLSIIGFFVVILISGIEAAYAYYHTTASISILANSVGDFDMGTGDINMMIYKENDQGVFLKTYAVPSVGYKYDETLTKCTIACSTDSTSNCYYSYDHVNRIFSLTSDQKVTCKFYFKQEAASDINIYIMKEDELDTNTYEETSANTYNGKNYALIESIPAYGYEYVGYYCENEVESLNYNSNTKRFNVQTKTKNTCYAYFDNVSSGDLSVSVYVQSEEGSTVYNLVESIPASKEYVLSTSKTSACYDAENNNTNALITYEDGYINISATGQQTCEVYLDLVTNTE